MLGEQPLGAVERLPHVVAADEGARDTIMVYGTSTQFEPAFEGRIADAIERAPLPEDWQRYIEAR